MQTGLDGLQALVRDSTASGVARRALLLRMDRLPPRLSRPHHLRLARAALDPLTAADRARKHELPGGRIALSWRGAAPGLLRESLQALEALLQGAPSDAPGMPELVGLYDLPQDGPALLHEAGAAARPEPDAAALPGPAWSDPAPRAMACFDAVSLSRMEAMLAGADLARFARRRPVCRLGAAGPQLAWEERLFSVTELTEAVAPGPTEVVGRGPTAVVGLGPTAVVGLGPTEVVGLGLSAEADPWLFRRLTRLLDRRMLALLASANELRGAGPFAVALNSGSLLGPDFLRFDATLPPGLRGHVVLNLAPADVLADPAAFVFARGFARARGYRLALAGVTAAMLPVLNLPWLELDYVGLRWSPESARPATALPDAGLARWVLSGADTEAAVGWGMRAGIGLFQGAAMRPPPLAASQTTR